MRDDLKADLVVDALSTAVARRSPKPGLVHQSDIGAQYASLAFGRTLRESGLVASMGSRGDAYDSAAYDSAAYESFISTIKSELINRNAKGRYIHTLCGPKPARERRAASRTDDSHVGPPAHQLGASIVPDCLRSCLRAHD